MEAVKSQENILDKLTSFEKKLNDFSSQFELRDFSPLQARNPLMASPDRPTWSSEPDVPSVVQFQQHADDDKLPPLLPIVAVHTAHDVSEIAVQTKLCGTDIEDDDTTNYSSDSAFGCFTGPDNGKCCQMHVIDFDDTDSHCSDACPVVNWERKAAGTEGQAYQDRRQLIDKLNDSILSGKFAHPMAHKQDLLDALLGRIPLCFSESHPTSCCFDQFVKDVQKSVDATKLDDPDFGMCVVGSSI